jgi:copper chaperone CopZ
MNTGPLDSYTLTSDKITGDGDRDKLETALSSLEGVRDVEVDPSGHSVTVSYDPTILDPTKVQAEIENAGYAASKDASASAAGEYLSSDVEATGEDTDRDRSGLRSLFRDES